MGARDVILVAGPPCSGKSFVVNRLRSGNLPHLEHALLGARLEDWSFVYAGNLPADPDEGRFVAQYDFLKQWKRDPLTWCYGKDPSLRGLRTAQHGVIVTVYAPMPALLTRVRERRRRLLVHALTHPFLLKRDYRELLETHRLLGLYTMLDPFSLYHRWFEFSKGHCAEHWVLEYDGQRFSLSAAGEWENRQFVP